VQQDSVLSPADRAPKRLIRLSVDRTFLQLYQDCGGLGGPEEEVEVAEVRSRWRLVLGFAGFGWYLPVVTSPNLLVSIPLDYLAATHAQSTSSAEGCKSKGQVPVIELREKLCPLCLIPLHKTRMPILSFPLSICYLTPRSQRPQHTQEHTSETPLIKRNCRRSRDKDISPASDLRG
jgi:hypothetical protein